MKIAVNARMLSQRKPGGITTYSLEILRRITAMHPEHSFLFIQDRPYSQKHLFPNNVSWVKLFPSIHPLIIYPWFEWFVPLVLRRFDADVFLSTDGFTSLSTSVPSVIVIHDLGFHHHPLDLPVFHRYYYNTLFPRYAKKATVIATVSEFSKRDIVATYAQPPEKIWVTYNAVGEEFHPLSESEKTRAEQDFAGGHPYLLHVGLIHPRKNIVRIMEAYDQFRRQTSSDVKLVFAGPKLFKTGKIFQTWNRLLHKDDVIFTGTVSQEILVQLYGGARALIYASRFEGFGIPVLEAMACGTPVICSNKTSLPEICGEAAFMVDPLSVNDIVQAMHAVVFDDGLWQSLVTKGAKRKADFSWKKTARILWQAVERAF